MKMCFNIYFNIKSCLREKEYNMIRSLNILPSKASILTKVPLSQKIIKNQSQELRLSRATSHKDIKAIKPLPEHVIQQREKRRRVAILIVRNTLKHNLQLIFRKIAKHVIVKKTSYKLLTSKLKRNVEAAFLTMKSYKIKKDDFYLQRHFGKQTEIKLFASIIKKQSHNNLESAFICIKDAAIHAKQLRSLCHLLGQCVKQCIGRLCYHEVFNILKRITIKKYQRELYMANIQKFYVKRLRYLSFNAVSKMKDAILLGQYRNTSEIRNIKNVQFAQMSLTRRQFISQLRQKTKALRITIDQQKVNKNKALLERKKFNHSNKLALVEIIRRFDKDIKDENEVTKYLEETLLDRQSLLKNRSTLKLKSEGSITVCFDLYSSISKLGGKIKSLQEIDPQITIYLNSFQESEIYLLNTNFRLEKLIEIYEKREPYNYQSEYYEVQYENNVVKQMVGCFIHKQYLEQMKGNHQNVNQIGEEEE